MGSLRTGISPAPAKMGRGSNVVVDGQLKVYGIDGLQYLDASVLPRVTTGNTMAPIGVIGQRAAEMLRGAHRIDACKADPQRIRPGKN